MIIHIVQYLTYNAVVLCGYGREAQIGSSRTMISCMTAGGCAIHKRDKTLLLVRSVATFAVLHKYDRGARTDVIITY